eukprot:1156257-Pelagomonas_calceolata.AAC.8
MFQKLGGVESHYTCPPIRKRGRGCVRHRMPQNVRHPVPEKFLKNVIRKGLFSSHPRCDANQEKRNRQMDVCRHGIA